MLLRLTDVDAFYGSFQALRKVSLSVASGQIVALLGGNASGKSTTLKAILGMVNYRGSVCFLGSPVDRLPTWKRVRNGVAVVPEGRRVFPGMTIRDNLTLGLPAGSKPRDRKECLDWLFALFPVLWKRLDDLGGNLSGGEQQMLAIARALLMRPKLLLMDEPSMGLPPDLVRRHAEVVEDVARRGVGVLLVEQHANIAMTIADQGYVLRQGEVIMEGDARQLEGDEVFRRAYLGGSSK